MHLSLKRNKGLTLIELLLVLSLLSVLSLMTIPNLLRSNNRWILRSTAYMIANDIRRIQRMSVQECTQYNFELQTKQFYYILRNNDPTHHNIKKVQLNPKITSITSTLYNPGYAGPKEGYRILRFSYLGSPNQAGEIVLETGNGDNIRLTVDVATGRVKVYD
ncbi:MAG: prepilin-type N-terminal cleavage/methylation domain-containing protein [Caldicoprobacterales bacterium]|jgi:prepilin-type N-terminal cleavage/methylation domain-containing protein|nr:prepilin-type N-terminal cleavage/methylation domain-containing protein [Clostridiales bacterium]